jgi:hypothetical protein
MYIPCAIPALLGVTAALPAFLSEIRQLIDISPVISPKIGIGGDNSCLGLGISVCNPINVDGTQNSYNSAGDDSDTTESTDEDVSQNGGLLGIDLDLSPILDLGGDNSCLGLGISACDPINVDGTQNSHNTAVNGDGNSQAESESGTAHESNALINLSPDISPELDIGGDNSCLGVGVSVCDPINVGGTQGSNNS